MCVIFAVLSTGLSACKTVAMRPWYGSDMIKIVPGSHIVSKVPIQDGYGPAFTEFTVNEVSYLLSSDYFEYVAEQAVEK